MDCVVTSFLAMTAPNPHGNPSTVIARAPPEAIHNPPKPFFREIRGQKSLKFPTLGLQLSDTLTATFQYFDLIVN